MNIIIWFNIQAMYYYHKERLQQHIVFIEIYNNNCCFVMFNLVPVAKKVSGNTPNKANGNSLNDTTPKKKLLNDSVAKRLARRLSIMLTYVK